jgi:beta-galactosidase
MNLIVHANGTIVVSYDYTPINAKGLLLEAGVALTVPATASEFQWIGAGPYAGYPGKDVLNEFGIYHLARGDLNFSGNRRGVEFAALTSPQGAGLLLIPDQPGDVAVESTAAGTVFSHNALLSGRGTKFVGPDTFIKSEAAVHIAGQFTLVPLTDKWPAQLTRWLGAPSAAKPFQPYYHSYDQ